MNEFDYCDRCGAAGKVFVLLPSGNDLVFCGHHGREYQPKLIDIAAELEYNDEYSTLQPA